MKLEDWHESVQGYVIDCLDWFDLERYDRQCEKWDAEQWRKAIAFRQVMFHNSIKYSHLLKIQLTNIPRLNDFFVLLSSNPDELLTKGEDFCQSLFKESLQGADSSVLTDILNSRDNFASIKNLQIDKETFDRLKIISYIDKIITFSSINAQFQPVDLVTDVDLNYAKKLVDIATLDAVIGLSVNIVNINTNAPDEEIKESFVSWLENYRKNHPELRPKPRRKKTEVLKPTDYKRFIDWRLLPSIDFDYWRIFRNKDILDGKPLEEVLFPSFADKYVKPPKSGEFKDMRHWLLSSSGYAALSVSALKLPKDYPAIRNPPRT